MQHVKQTWGYIIDSIHFTFFNYPCEIGDIAFHNKYKLQRIRISNIKSREIQQILKQMTFKFD